jgi:diacylglycerol diphosphate phosphatase / phosphatidate phosphatase
MTQKLQVYEAHPAPSRSFPVFFQDGEIVYPEFAYPLRKEIVPIWAAAMLGTLVPIFIVLCMQVRIRSFWDANNAIIGIFYSLINAAVFQVFLKWLIGGLRPHFLTVCKPSIPEGTEMGNGLRSIMYNRNICTGDRDEIDDSLESFPSGHSTAACEYLQSKVLNIRVRELANILSSRWLCIPLPVPQRKA